MWIAREPDGQLKLFADKPYRESELFNEEFMEYWWATYDGELRVDIPIKDFPEVTFDNSPIEVEVKIKIKNK